MSGSSSAASNSAEKCAPHITPAKSSQATTGKASTRITREWRTGSIDRWRVAGREPQDQGHRPGQRDQRRRDQGQQHVLDHVDREQRRVVPVDPGQQGEGDGQQAAGEGDRARARHRVRRVRPVDLPDGPPPPADGGQQAERGEGFEGPAEQQVGDRRRLVGDGSVRRDDAGRDQPGEP